MSLRYSNSTGNFYPDSESYSKLPNDAIVVSHEDMARALNRSPELNFKFSKDGALSFYPNPAAVVDVSAIERAKRDGLLSACDYFAMPDYPLTATAKNELSEYRQLLRDVTGQSDFPNKIEWPIKPGFVK